MTTGALIVIVITLSRMSSFRMILSRMKLSRMKLSKMMLSRMILCFTTSSTLTGIAMMLTEHPSAK